MTYTATYSPEDNKLRLFSSTRLDRELYARVRGAGFIYAPKQELFVAPMWTPEREDLLIELCGEIDDEDTSLVERAEVRADRFADYKDKRISDAERAQEAVSRIVDNIPLGQPILIGHHSERHARKDAERIENGMRKTVKMWHTAKYWEDRAKGALRHAKYKVLPGVRHRRIKGLEADLRRYQNSFTPAPKTKPQMWDGEEHVWITNGSRGGRWAKSRSLPAIEQQSRRWIEHLQNRIAYEKAMLGEAGGIAAAQFTIEVGGRVLVADEWVVVLKLNSVGGTLNSVSTTPLRHWHGSSTKVEIERVKDYRAPGPGDTEKVKAATKLPPLCNYPGEGFAQMTQAEWDKKHKDYKTTRAVDATATHARHRVTISDSYKKELKRKHRTTMKGRTPLGDKGLGRLGTQRLGSKLQISTSTGDGTERTVSINWNEFNTGRLLEEVPVSYGETSRSVSSGTRLFISGLRDVDSWKKAGREEHRKQLSQMISPYRAVREFDVVAKFDGEELDLYEITTKLRNAALSTYRLDFDNETFSIRGRTKLDYIRPDKGKKEKALFDELVTRDGGDKFFGYLKTLKGERQYGFDRDSGKWWAKFHTLRPLEAFDALDIQDGVIASPGPFSGEVDYYGFGKEAIANQNVFTDGSDYRALIHALSGIRVYRDGFGIRLGHDWLQLGEQWTSAPSYYGLKPQNTMGYIAITARDNQSLEEKTDREGFSDNPSYRNFRELLRYFVSHVGEAQEFLRRGWNDFKSLKVREPLNIADSVTPEDLTSSVKSALSRAPSYRLALSRTARKLTETADHSETLKPLSSQPNLSDKEKAEYDRFLVGADKTLSDARQIVNEVDEYFKELSKAEQLSQVLSDQIEALREQMRQMHELIALGLTAEALSHQIATLASSLAERNDQILRYLRGAGPRDSRLISYAEHVKSVIAGLRKELSYLAPSLQYVRERRDEFYVHDLATELLKRHLAGFSTENISMRVTGSAASNFRVKVNKGKMVQVFENLLINAEYWLKEDLRLHRIMHGQIDIETKRPMVFVSDNGRGVDPRLEDTLFEPFVSGKGKGKGRGLGLFIVQQLLSSEGCFVSLSEERNKFERRFRFEMDLKGMLTD